MQSINPIEYKGWDDLIAEHPGSSVFHSSHWAKVLSETYNYIPRYFIQQSEKGLEFMLPVMEVRSSLTGIRGISLPFTDFCEPYIERKAGFNEIFERVTGSGKDFKWKFLEIRGGGDLLENINPSLEYFGHKLKLTNETGLWAGLKSNTKRNIKKAQKEGVTVDIAGSAQAMHEFYRLNCITRRKHGLPPQPYQFFRNVYEHIIKAGFGSIISAFYGRTIIAASIYFHSEDQVLYKYGASDIAHIHTRANQLIMWEAIKHYTGMGYTSLDFGKTDMNNDGLRRYKLSWGTSERKIKYFRYDLRTDQFITDQTREEGWYNHIFSRMPLPLLRAVGKLTYRHIA